MTAYAGDKIIPLRKLRVLHALCGEIIVNLRKFCNSYRENEMLHCVQHDILCRIILEFCPRGLYFEKALAPYCPIVMFGPR